MDTALSVFLQSMLAFSLLFAGIWLIKTVLKKHLSALAQYVLWAIVIAKLVVPVGLPNEASPWNLLSSTAQPQQVQQNLAPEASFTPVLQGKSAPADAQNAQVIFTEMPAPQQDAAPIETVQTPPVVQWDWKAVAAAGWISGILAMLIWMLASAVRIRRQLAKNSVGEASGLAEYILEECRRELKIKRRICLTVQRVFPIPAVMGLFKPMLILPAQILREEDAEGLRHIILHELTHYKNGDIPVTLLLNILNAVYWFNPLVWLLVRLARRDMETLCDNRVIARIGKERRQEYIRTILRFSDIRPVLSTAMSLNDGRIPMRRRIQGMFLRKKTRIWVKIPVLLLCCVAVFVCFTTGCQPTPMQAPVVNKNNLEAKISATPSPQSTYDAPANVKDSITQKNVTVSIDAPLSKPDVSKYPVYEVTQSAFTQAQVDVVGKVLLQDNTLFSLPKQNGMYMTKNDIMQEVTREKQQLAEVKKMGDSEFKDVFDGQSREDAYAVYQKQIDAYMEQYKTAPDEWGEGKQPATLQLPPPGGNKSSELDVYTDLGNGIYPRFMVDNSYIPDAGYIVSNMEYRYFKGYSVLGRIFSDSATPKGVSISREDAVLKAQQAVEQMGMTDMKAAKTGILDLYLMDSSHSQDTKQCWGVEFERMLDGIAVSDIQGAHASDTANKPTINNDYAPTYEPEELLVCIGDEGVIYFSWSGNATIKEKKSANVALLPFSEILQRAKKNMFYKLYAEEDTKVSIQISQIRLSLMRIQQKDQPDSYLVVPVWDFTGTMTESPGRESAINRDTSFMTINAIDGSVIDREKGY